MKKLCERMGADAYRRGLPRDSVPWPVPGDPLAEWWFRGYDDEKEYWEAEDKP